MEAISAPDHEVSIDISAPPATVWAVVSDITRTPEWSPVVQSCQWLDEASVPAPEVGRRFRGRNRFNGFRWSRDCVITEARPERVLCFSTFGGDQEQTRWRYRLDAIAGGTKVSLAYQIVSMPRWVRLLRRLPRGAEVNDRQARWNMEQSLQRLSALVTAQG